MITLITRWNTKPQPVQTVVQEIMRVLEKNSFLDMLIDDDCQHV